MGRGRSTPEAVEERFWSKVDVRNPFVCWPWLGSLGHNGYARFSLHGKTVRAHRYMYELMVGTIEPNMTIDHVAARGCTLRHCVNPYHLEQVTMKENVLRGDTITAHNKTKTECISGHSFEFWGYIDYTGARQCKLCSRRRTKEHRLRKRLEAES